MRLPNRNLFINKKQDLNEKRQQNILLPFKIHMNIIQTKLDYIQLWQRHKHQHDHCKFHLQYLL